MSAELLIKAAMTLCCAVAVYASGIERNYTVALWAANCAFWVWMP